MSRIENTQQLAQLRLQYATTLGAQEAAAAAQQAAMAAAQRYVEMISMLTGETIPHQAQVHVDWRTGEVTVTVQDELYTPNGVAV